MKKVFKKIKKKATGGGGRSNSPGAASNASSTNAAAVEAADGAAASKKQRTGSSASGLKRGSVTSLLSNIAGPSASSKSSYPDKSTSGASKLHLAVWNEDVERVKKLVQKNDVNLVNSQDGKGRAPLHLAAQKGIVSIVWPLLSHGASVHARDGEGATPLHRAVAGSYSETAQMLLDRGCQLDVADSRGGDTVLHLATRAGNNSILAVLLRKGANPDIANKAKETPLHESIRLGHHSSAQMLLRCGASVNLPGGRNGLTPLMLAAAAAGPKNAVDVELLETLLEYEADVHLEDKRGWNAMKHAEEVGHPEVVHLLQRHIEALEREAEGEFVLPPDHDTEFDSYDEGHRTHDYDNLGGFGAPMASAAGTAAAAAAKDERKHRKSGRSRASSRKSGLSQKERVAISDLSSWGSDEDEEGSEKAVAVADQSKTATAAASPKGGMTHSKGVMDLSKFLRSDDDGDDNKNDEGEDADDGASRKIEDNGAVGGRIEKASPVPKTEVAIERRGTPPPSSEEEDSSWGDESVADQLLASGSGQQVKKNLPPPPPMPLATKASALDDDDHRKSLPDAKNTTAMTKPPLPRKPSLETTTKKDLSSTVGNDEAAKISSSAQPSPVVEKPVAQVTTENACEDSWDDEGGGGEEGEEEPDSRRIDNGATVPNDNQNLGKASRQSSRRPSEETHLVLGGGERSGEGMSIRREQSESQNEGNEKSAADESSAKAPPTEAISIDSPEVSYVRRGSSFALERSTAEGTPLKSSTAVAAKKKTKSSSSARSSLRSKMFPTAAKKDGDGFSSSSSVESTAAAKPPRRKSSRSKKKTKNSAAKSSEKDKKEPTKSEIPPAATIETNTKSCFPLTIEDPAQKKNGDKESGEDVVRSARGLDLGQNNPPSQEAGMISEEMFAMDKSDLLVHVQKLSMMLEQERAMAAKGVGKMRKREESPSALRILEEDNKKLKEELVHISISLQQHKKAKAAAEEHSGKERRRIDELEAIQAERDEEATRLRKLVQEMKVELGETEKLKNRDLDLEEKKAVLLAKLEEAELGERAALLEASRIKEDNEGLKVDLDAAKRELVDERNLGDARMREMEEEIRESEKDRRMADEKLKANVLGLQNALDRSKDQEERLEKELAEEKRKKMTAVAATEKESSEEEERLRELLAEAEARSAALSSQLASAADAREKLEAEVSRLNAETDKALKERDEVKGSASSAMVAKEAAEAKAAALEREIEELEAQREKSEAERIRNEIVRSKEVESQLEESIKGHAALEERHKELAKANEDMAIEVKVLRQELLDSKETTARSDHLNKAVKEKLARDKELLESRHTRLEGEVERLSKELSERGDEALKESKEHEALITRSMEERKRVQEEKANVEKKLRALRSDVDDRDTTITLVTEELNDTRAAVEALEEELTEWRSKQSTDTVKMRRAVAEREAGVKRAAAENKKLERLVKELEGNLADADEKEARMLREAEAEMTALKKELERTEMRAAARERELGAAKETLSARSEARDERRRVLNEKESEVGEAALQLQFSEKRVASLETHVGSLNGSIKRLEQELEASAKEKKEVFVQLKRKEAEMDTLSVEVVNELKVQLKGEKARLEREQSNAEILGLRKGEIEREAARLRAELDEAKGDLAKSDESRRALRTEIREVTTKVQSLEERLEEEGRKQSRFSSTVSNLEEQIGEERERGKAAEQRIGRLSKEVWQKEEERTAAQNTVAEKAGQREAAEARVRGLEAQVEEHGNRNQTLEKRLHEANVRIGSLEVTVRKSKLLGKELARKDKAVRTLEERLTETRRSEAVDYEREARKFKLKYEILARNEINKKVSELNDFLGQRAKDQEESEKSREESMERIQKDLGDRLQISREELGAIKNQMKDTERGIKQLQTQLHSREQELILERNLRRQLQKELDNKINRNNIGGGGDVENSASNFLMDDYAKPYAYF